MYLLGVGGGEVGEWLGLCSKRKRRKRRAKWSAMESKNTVSPSVHSGACGPSFLLSTVLIQILSTLEP